jgi:glutamate racemase
MFVIDSGLGGLSVVRALRAARPVLPLVYLADTAGFPYGARAASDLLGRASSLTTQLVAAHGAAPIVIACNTLSTLCLADLRAAFTYPFVGTVPAIKVAASLSKTRRFTLLATPNTTRSPYSDALIAQFAADCVVDAVGAPRLAPLAEQLLLGESISVEEIRTEIAPAFHDDARGRTDTIILGCTHYPLILPQLKAAAPWEVHWVDSSEAIARRALSLDDTAHTPRSIAYVTAEADVARYQPLFLREGFDDVRALSV